MPIITKPGTVEKGSEAVFTLDKNALAALSVVSADEYFSVITNWSKVEMFFKSPVGNQMEVVAFDPSLASPVGKFLVSETARDVFEIEKIIIYDFDGGNFLVKRENLTVAEFDVDLGAVPPLAGAIQWNANVNYTFNNANGGMTTTNTNMVNGFAVSTAISFMPSENKSVVYTLDVASITAGSTFGYYSNDPANYFHFKKTGGNAAGAIDVWSQAGPYSTVAIPTSGVVELKIQSKGSTSETKWFINGVEVASRGGVGSGPMYPQVMINSGSSITTSIIA